MLPTRRRFLHYLGIGTYALLSNPVKASHVAFPLSRRKGAPPAFFHPIKPNRADDLLVPEGYSKQIICAWGDPLGSKHNVYGPEKFGFNNDFLAYFPSDALTGGKNSNEGLLWVNHEYPNPLFVSHYAGKVPKSERQIVAEKLSVGGSVLHVRREGGKWMRVAGEHTRRFTALYPEFEVSGPASGLLPTATGTLANCSGGRTPWNTVLSCEENFQDYNPQTREGYCWADVEQQKIDENQYGWVAEIDPFGELPPRKLSALGRFAHENAAWRLGPSGRLVVYMGDDAADQYFYKFVSAAKYDPSAPRAEQRKLLEQGTLYAADFRRGKWLPLDLKRSKALRSAGFKSQGDVVLRARDASKVLGATPIDRPEDCEVHPADGTVYIALTNNEKHGNLYGQLVRLVEDNDNAEGESFRFEIFLAGGPQSGLACPDNLAFDHQCNLWVAADITSRRLNKEAYKPFGNNGLYVVPTTGDSAGDAFQFASGPVECELTGPWFNENYDTLFLAVQHPGEESPNLDQLTSHWPRGAAEIPRPAVVANTGFRW